MLRILQPEFRTLSHNLRRPRFEMKRAYTPREKAEALAHLAAEAGNVTRAARAANVPRKTLEEWRNGRGITSEVLRMAEDSKKILAGKFRRECGEALDAAAGKRDGATYQQLMVGAGISADKAQLLDSEPTQITEHRLTIVREAYREIKDLVPEEEARQLIARNFDLRPEDWRVIEGHGGEGLRAV